MIQNLKVLGLALVGALAFCVTGVSTASATIFEAEDKSTVLTGTTHDNIFNIPGGSSFQCTTSSFDGTALHGASTATVLPTYNGIVNETPHTNVKCTASLGSVTVDVNGCHYKLTGNTTGSDSGTDAIVWIECPAGQVIKITGPLGCSISVPSQTPTSGGVVYDNVSSHPGGSAIKVTATSTGITFTATANCGFVGIPSHGDNATYVGTVTATGYVDKGSEFSEGSQVGVSVGGGPPDQLLIDGDVSLVGEGTGIEDFSLNAGTAECTESAYTGTMEVSPASELTLTPAFAECDAFGYSNAEVITNGCDYLFHEGAEAEGGSFEGAADIKCPEGKSIEIVAKVRGLLKCRATIGTQSGLAGVTYSSSGSGSSRDLEFDIHLEKVKYTQDTGEGLGKCTAGSFEDGKVNGAPTVIGERSGEQVGVWVQRTGPREMHSEIEDTTLIGEDTGSEKIELSAGTAECLEAGYKGTLAAKDQLTWTLSPEFANCDAFGFSTAEVKWNGCAYELSIDEEKVGEAFEGVGAIQCAEGKTIEVIAESSGTLKCKATIGTQSGLTPVTYTNAGAGTSRDVKVDLSLSGVKYTQDAGEGAGKCTGGSFEDGKIVGSPTVIGESAEKKQIGIWIE
ncbi:MAG TPA: hypothetical protein VIS95_05755 [Solirubrobacterales bacterium]